MMKNSYTELGRNIFKYIQIVSILFSLLLIVVLIITGSSFYFSVVFAISIVLLNLYWNIFKDIKWNTKCFVIDSLFRKKIEKAEDFLKIERIFFNISKIKFRNKEYYYVEELASIFTDSFYTKKTAFIKASIQPEILDTYMENNEH